MGIFDPPQMPQFREAGGGWDWRQFADMMIPGNVWDSRTNEWRPRGIAAGAASTAFGPLAGALVEAMPDRMPQMPSFNGLGDWLSRRTGRDDSARPSQYGPRRSDLVPPVNVIGGGTYQEEQTNPRMSNPNARDVVGEDVGPRARRGGQGGYNGMTWSAAQGVGESTRRTNDQAMQEALSMLERTRNRNGALMER